MISRRRLSSQVTTEPKKIKLSCQKCGSPDVDIEKMEWHELQTHLKAEYDRNAFPRLLLHCNACQHELLL